MLTSFFELKIISVNLFSTKSFFFNPRFKPSKERFLALNSYWMQFNVDNQSFVADIDANWLKIQGEDHEV